MMRIVKPLPIAGVSVSAGAATVGRLLTPSPRECWTGVVGVNEIIVDLGEERLVSTVYLGGANASADAVIQMFKVDDFTGAASAQLTPVDTFRMWGAEPRYARLATFEAQIARLLKIVIDQAIDPLQLGCIVVGNGLDLPYEWGAGRTPIDLSKVTQLSDGGVGIEPGAIVSQFRATASDLSDADVDALWDIYRTHGTQKPVVLIEDLDRITQASVHYGLFVRPEAYERRDPTLTRWSVGVTEIR